MTAPTRQHKPGFFWQGVFLVLPVAVLALVSVRSLQRDEVAAERAARERAAQNVQNLAEVVRYLVGDEVQRFVTLQNMWTMSLRSTSDPAITGMVSDQVSSDIAKWERDYPGLKFTELATSQGALLEDGRQIEPPELPVVPVPPRWFRELSPQQRELWQALRMQSFGTDGFREARAAFVASDVSDEAQQAAINLEQRLGRRLFNFGFPLEQSEYAESGVSFRGIALAQMLLDKNLAPSNSVQSAFWDEVINHPSFLAAQLLELAEARTHEADARTLEKLGGIRQRWDIQLKMRAWLVPLRSLPELREKWHPPEFWAHWTTGPAGDALAFFAPTTFRAMESDPAGGTDSGRGHQIWFVPRPVFDAIFTRVLTEKASLIPDFVDVLVLLAGKPLRSLSIDTPAQQSLGVAKETFGRGDCQASFEIRYYLRSRDKMLSAEHRRARLFGLLILGTVATAGVGLFASYRAFRQQLQLNEQKSNFVSSVSHELRAPIASVRLLAESLERGKISEPGKQHEYFRFIGQECRRLSALIENVLDFSRIEQGRKQYEFEPTDLSALVEQTVKLMQPYAEERGVLLKSEIRNPKSEMELDGRAMQQALVNLIDNAIKHSPRDAEVTVSLATVHVTRTTHHAPPIEDEGRGRTDSPSINQQPSPVTLLVSDHGPGIPASEHEKIFERFYRLGSELRRETQGVGIGLSIVKHVAEAHGGRVRVESELGQGSRFTIELPVVKSEIRNPKSE